MDRSLPIDRNYASDTSTNGEDLLGETVNIAARLESLAYPAAFALDKVIDALRLTGFSSKGSARRR